MAKLNEYERGFIFDENMDPILITDVVPCQELLMGRVIELKGVRVGIDTETNSIKNGKEVRIIASFNIEDIAEVE